MHVGPPEGWDPTEATERVRSAAHRHPAHQAARESWAQQEDQKKYCERCEADPETVSYRIPEADS